MYYITVTDRKNGQAVNDAVLTFERDGCPLFCAWTDKNGGVLLTDITGFRFQE